MKQQKRRSVSISLAFVLLFGVAGSVLLFVSHAATGTASVESENGTIAGATKLADMTASGGQAVKFVAGTTAGARTCLAYPAFPDASCTGVPAGVTLTAYSGSSSCGGTNCLTTAGMTLDSKTFTGGINICANNITITRSKIVGGRVDMSCAGSNTQYSGATFTDDEFAGNNTNDTAIRNSGFTCIRCNIHDYTQGVGTNDFTLQDSWIHDIYGFGDPATTGSHNEAVLGNSNITLKHNRLDAVWNSSTTGGGMSGVIAVYSFKHGGTDWGPASNMTVDQNRIIGSEGWCLYAGDDTGISNLHRVSNMVFTNNVFISNSASNLHTCGGYGAVTEYISGNGDVWTNNTYSDGVAISP